MFHQSLHFRHAFVPERVAPRAHALGKIHPKIRVRLGGVALTALLVAHVRQNGSAQFAVVQPQCKSRQVRRERMHVLVVVERIFSQIFARQFSRAPCLVKRMAEQIVLRNTGIEFRKNCWWS